MLNVAKYQWTNEMHIFIGLPQKNPIKRACNLWNSFSVSWYLLKDEIVFETFLDFFFSTPFWQASGEEKKSTSQVSNENKTQI